MFGMRRAYHNIVVRVFVLSVMMFWISLSVLVKDNFSTARLVDKTPGSTSVSMFQRDHDKPVTRKLRESAKRIGSMVSSTYLAANTGISSLGTT